MRRLLCLLAAALVAVASSPVHADEDLDDLMGGFDDDFDISIIEEDEDEAPEWLVSLPGGDWLWENVDIGGSLATGVVWNYLSHTVADSHVDSDGVPPAEPPGGRTDYGGLSRLDLDGMLQIDVQLPHEWQARAEVLAWYDFAYTIQGRSDYNAAVLDVYEWQVDTGEVYLSGPISGAFDLTIGRKIVNWGRSDTFRVVDVVNPLDNKEPGLVDIEDIRRARGMVKLDYQSGRWAGQALLLVEHRYDRQPPPGSDFFPWVDLRDIPDPPPALGLTKAQLAALLGQLAGEAFASEPPTQRVDRWGATPEFGLALTGIFSGWDFSLYAARLYQNRTTVIINLPTVRPPGILTDEDRITMVGGGGNYTFGAWLVKAELAWLDELDYVYLQTNTGSTPGDSPLAAYRIERSQVSRVDWMLGVEYYGITNVNVALELAHRHVLGYVDELQYLPNYVYRDNVEVALRVSSEHLNARLKPTLLALVLANERGFAGATLRLSADYELRGGLIGTLGYLHFFGADQIPFDTWDANDRLFAKLKLSF